MIKQTLTDFFNFLKKPTDTQLHLSTWKKLKMIFILFIAEVIIFISIIYPIITGIDYLIPLKSVRVEEDKTFLFYFLTLVVFAPIFEEFLFRWVLRRQTLIESLVPQQKWDKIFPFLVYFTAIAFGFVHISNYTNEELLFYILSPIILITQLLGGFVITFIRVRFNIFWGMLYHALWNFSMAFMMMVAWDFVFQKPYQETSHNYNIEVTESYFYDNDQKPSIKISSDKDKIYQIEAEQYEFQKLLDTLYQKDKFYIDDVYIKLKFQSEKGISKSEFLEILKKEYDIK